MAITIYIIIIITILLLVLWVEVKVRKKQNLFLKLKGSKEEENIHKLPSQIPLVDKDPILGLISFFFRSLQNESQSEVMKKRFANPETKIIKTQVAVLFGVPFVSTWNLEFCKQIFIKDRNIFSKNIPIPSIMKLFGLSVAIVDGNEWKRQREILNPSFRLDYIKSLTATFIEYSEKLCSQLEVYTGENKKFQPYNWMNKFTLDNLGKAGFGFEFHSLENGDKTSVVYEAYCKLSNSMVDPLRIIPYFEKLPLSRNQEFEKYRAIFFDWAKQMIDKKRELQLNDNNSQAHEIPDLLAAMVSAHDNKGLTDDELLQNIFLFFTAGHETTSGSLTGVLYFLAKYPDLQEQCFDEMNRVIGDDDVSHLNVKKLTTLNNVINETMRLLNPARSVIRKTVDDCQLGEYFIPKGTFVSVGIRNLHLDPDTWGPDANEFSIDRWSHEKVKERPSIAFMPFGYGPRICLGLNFALLEIRIALVYLLRKFKFIHQDEWKPTRSITERPQDGFCVGIQMR